MKVRCLPGKEGLFLVPNMVYDVAEEVGGRYRLVSSNAVFAKSRFKVVLPDERKMPKEGNKITFLGCTKVVTFNPDEFLNDYPDPSAKRDAEHVNVPVAAMTPYNHFKDLEGWEISGGDGQVEWSETI